MSGTGRYLHSLNSLYRFEKFKIAQIWSKPLLVILNTLSDKIPQVSLPIKVKKMLNRSAVNFNELGWFNSAQWTPRAHWPGMDMSFLWKIRSMPFYWLCFKPTWQFNSSSGAKRDILAVSVFVSEFFLLRGEPLRVKGALKVWMNSADMSVWPFYC